MGLDSSLRKLSKTKLQPFLDGKTPFHAVPGIYALSNELAYWRNHRTLNKWMIKLADEKLFHKADKADVMAIMNGAPLFLDESDILRLKMDIVFGDLATKYWDDWTSDLFYESAPETARLVAKDIEVCDRAIRILRRKASVIYYTASW